MTQPGDVEAPDAISTWRERALERSLRGARAKAISRSDRFIEVAMELLSETGRTDFTVQELVESGVSEGKFRDDIDAETLAMILMQTLVTAAHMHALGAYLTGETLDAERLWAFCLGGLTNTATIRSRSGEFVRARQR